MKRGVYLTALICCLCSSLVMAQTIAIGGEEVLLKGYLVTWYKASEVFELKNPKSSKSMIDYEKYANFLPITTDITDVSVVDSIELFNGNHVVSPASDKTSFLIGEYGKRKIAEYFKIPQDSIFNGSFFELNKNKDYLYKVYYIESKAIKVKIPNTSENASVIGIPHNKKYEFLTCYFMYRDILLQEIKDIHSDVWKRIY
jgi:hypothetical protein